MLKDDALIPKACAAYRQYLYYKPDDIIVMTALATAYGMSGEYEKSIATFERVQKIAPEDPTLLYNMGNSYHRQGNYIRAMMCYEKAIEILPTLIVAHINLELARTAFRGKGK